MFYSNNNRIAVTPGLYFTFLQLQIEFSVQFSLLQPAFTPFRDFL